MSNEALNKVKVRIQALLAKANSTDNEHEAEAFLAKVNELLEQYQLDLGDLTSADDPIIHHTGMARAESGHAWRWKLYSAVGRLYGCKSIHVDVGLRDNGRGKRVPFYEQRLVGRESAILTTDLMYPWIVGQVKAKAKDIAELTGMSEQGQAKRVAGALLLRIYKLIAANADTPTLRTEAAKNSLVVIHNAVEKHFEDLYPNNEKMRATSVRTDGLSKAAADSIGLHRQAGGTAKTLRLS